MNIKEKLETTPCPKCHQTGWCEHRNEAAKRMLDCARAAAELEKKTDEEIAKLLEDHVWADISMLDPKSDLVSEVIERLRRAKGGARPEEVEAEWCHSWCHDYCHEPGCDRECGNRCRLTSSDLSGTKSGCTG